MDIVYQAVDGSASTLSAKLDHLTASSADLQLWHFVVVQDRDTSRQLGSLVKTGLHIAQAPLALVAIETGNRFGVSKASRAIQDTMLIGLEKPNKVAHLEGFEPPAPSSEDWR